MPDDHKNITQKDLERIIADPAMRTYLRGLFACARTLVTHNTSIRDYIESELDKPDHSPDGIKDVLADYELKMQNLLGSFLEAEQLLYGMDTPPEIYAVDVSATLMELTAKMRNIFGDSLRFVTDIDTGVIAVTSKSSLEIAVNSLIARIIQCAEEPGTLPSEILMRLKTIESNGYLEIMPTKLGGTYTVPPESLVEQAFFTCDFNLMFLTRYAKDLGGAFFVRNNGFALSFKVAPAGTPLVIARDVLFEFDNARFSPTAAKMSKYVNNHQ
jgi:hypothetical protein